MTAPKPYARAYAWRAWLPMKDTPDGTIDTLIAKPGTYATKVHAFDVTGKPFPESGDDGVTRVTLCGRTAPRYDDHLGWYYGDDEAELRGRCARCEAALRKASRPKSLRQICDEREERMRESGRQEIRERGRKGGRTSD